MLIETGTKILDVTTDNDIFCFEIWHKHKSDNPTSESAIYLKKEKVKMLIDFLVKELE